MYIFSVFYYNTLAFNKITYPLGHYDNLDDAKNRLKTIMPNYKQWVNNTVGDKHLIGWINKNSFGDLSTNMSASQPHSAINLFEE